MATQTHLEITLVQGTSALDRVQFAVNSLYLGYVASGGVVVCRLEGERTTNQRFYGATQVVPPSGHSNPEGLERSRDAYGFARGETSVWGSTATPSPAPSSPGRPVGVSKYRTPDLPLKLRLRTVHCLALSPDGTLLAVGESGHQPRILIYSLAPDGSAAPLACIHEHQHGVHSLVFSPNSESLCSLGFGLDGFLHVWRLHRSPLSLAVSLSQSNKCSTLTHKVMWVGDTIVALGLRFIKLWYVQDGPRSPTKTTALRGRNVVMGEFLSSSFVDATVLDNETLLFLTDQAEMARVSLTDECLQLVKLVRVAVVADAIVVDRAREGLWIAAPDGVQMLALAELVPDPEYAVRRTLASVQGPKPSKPSAVLAMGAAGPNQLVLLRASKYISIHNMITLALQDLVCPLLEEVGGLKQCSSGDTLVFSRSAVVKRILNPSPETTQTPTPKILPNHVVSETHPSPIAPEILLRFDLPSNALIANGLTCLDALGPFVVLGDCYGSIYIFSSSPSAPHVLVFSTRAHESSVTDVVIFEVEGRMVVASTSRDKTIQVLTASPDGGWLLLNTLSAHRSTATQILHHNNCIIVSSSDRSVSIHRVMREGGLEEELKNADLSEGLGREGAEGFEKEELHNLGLNAPGPNDLGLTVQPNISGPLLVVQEKILILKHAPVTMKMVNNQLVVSTTDKALAIFDPSSNWELLRTLKVFDSNNEPLLVENFLVQRNHLYVSCSDKSFRLFQFSTGKPIASSGAHSDPVVGLATAGSRLLTLGGDGCLFLWERRCENTVDVRDAASPLCEAQDWLHSPLNQKVARKLLLPVGPSALTNPLSRTSSPRSPPRSPSWSPSLRPTRPPPAARLRSPLPTTDGKGPCLGPKLPSWKFNATHPLPNAETNSSTATRVPENPSPSLQRRTFVRALCSPLPASSKNALLRGRAPATKLPLQTILSTLSLIQADYDTYTPQEAVAIRNALVLVVQATTGDLLESYSDRLMEMMERKLSHSTTAVPLETAVTVVPVVPAVPAVPVVPIVPVETAATVVPAVSATSPSRPFLELRPVSAVTLGFAGLELD